MTHTRNNEFTDKQKRGIDLVVKSVAKKYPFIKGWEFTKNFKDYTAHLYINLIVDFDEVAKFYNETLHPAYAERKIPLISSLIKTFLSSNPILRFDSPERDEFFEKNYNDTKKITNLISSVYKSLPEDFLTYYNYESWDGTVKKSEVDLSVSDFFDVTAV